MNHPVLSAVARSTTTKGELRQFRLAGRIPAVIYGGGQAAVHILLNEQEFIKATTGISESTILDIDIGGKKTQAFVKEHQRDTLSGKIIHVDLLEVVSGRSIHAKVPLHLIGTPVGVKEGGILENPAHEVEVECDPSRLPEKIEVDISGLQANHSIHVRNIAAIEGVKILTSPELVVAVVKFAKAEVVETPAVAEATPAAGAAAAPGAAPAAAGAGAAAGASTDKKEEKK
ncbi:MAG TPA: 50S ribosomal protein L25 [Rectinemataceae bacterium]|nr:50S ribosomal protein L25 [Rectinemataceae bacterium]